MPKLTDAKLQAIINIIANSPRAIDKDITAIIQELLASRVLFRKLAWTTNERGIHMIASPRVVDHLEEWTRGES